MTIFWICFLTLLPTFSLLAEMGVQGKITLENERYRDDGEEYAHTIDRDRGVFAKIDAHIKTDRTLSQLGLAWRENHRDHSRDMLIFQDAYFSLSIGEQRNWRILAGYKLYNWSVLESFHPVDRLHTANYGSSPEEWEKLPEAVIELERYFDSGTLSFYFFPRFQEPIFPDGKSRKVLIDNGSRIKMAKPSKIIDGKVVASNNIPQFGVRGTWSGDSFDMGLHLLRHLDRKTFISGTHEYKTIGTPPHRITIPLDFKSFVFSPIPYFIQAWELGITLESVHWDTLFKFESTAMKYDKHGPILSSDGLEEIEDHVDYAFGIEKNFTLLSGQDTDFFIEFAKIAGPSKWERIKISAFQQDLFVGVQHRFNNELDSKLEFGYITDLEGRSEKLHTMSYSQRLGGDWSISAGGRRYRAPPKEETAGTVGLENYHKDDSVFVNLSWHI